MATLSGQTIANTFDSLLHVEDDTAGLVATSTDSRVIQDGVGAASALALATDSVRITSTNKLYFNDIDGEYISGDGTDLTITSGNDIKLAVGAAGSVHSAGVAGTSNTVLGVDAGIGLEAGSNYNVFIGDLVGDSTLNDAINNVGVGYNSMSALTTGDRNVCMGSQSGAIIDTGEQNVCIGANSGLNFDAESDNTFVGYNSGYGASTAARCVAVGSSSLASANTENGTVAVGYLALNALLTGAGNTALGYKAMAAYTDGASNTAVGYQAGEGMDIDDSDHNVLVGASAGGGAWASNASSQNVAIGSSALAGALNGSNNNVAIGNNALTSNTHGDENVVIGSAAGDAAVDVDALVIIGYQAGSGALTSAADASTYIGYQAGMAITSGPRNMAIGYQALKSATDADDNIAIGWNAMIDNDSNTFQDNIALGNYAMDNASNHSATAIKNVAIGNQTMRGQMTDATVSNVCVGFAAGTAMTSGNSNALVGAEAGKAILNGERNVCIGSTAGETIGSGHRNIIIGERADVDAESRNDMIVIGNNLEGGTNTRVHIGNATSFVYNDFNSNNTWTHSSDKRQKKDIQDDTLGLDFINELRSVTFKLKPPSEFPEEWDGYDASITELDPSDDKVIHGLVAQEVKSALDKSGVDTFSGHDIMSDGRQMIGDSAFVFPLIKAVQELSQQVEDLKAKIN